MTGPDNGFAARADRLARLDQMREPEGHTVDVAQFDLMDGGDYENDPEPGSTTGIKITPADRIHAQYKNRFEEATSYYDKE